MANPATPQPNPARAFTVPGHGGALYMYIGGILHIRTWRPAHAAGVVAAWVPARNLRPCPTGRPNVLTVQGMGPRPAPRALRAATAARAAAQLSPTRVALAAQQRAMVAASLAAVPPAQAPAPLPLPARVRYAH